VNELFPQLPIPEPIALEFLGTFARCEYALKCTRYARGNENSVEANWDKYAKDINWHFRRVKDKTFQRAVDFLLNEPPRKQVLRKGHLVWHEAPPNPKWPKAQQALLMVRRIRNNLFHGAKVWSPEYDNRDRDIRLLRAGLAVMQQSMLLDDEVHMAFRYGVF
jgi:hypothetical protein